MARSRHTKTRFMIHKHHATHLHYDLRIEIDGTLKSWALKELPLKPSHAVLAVNVPDHPLWYRHFEGVIPEGQYGAGPVMIWEKGLCYTFTANHHNKILDISTAYKNGCIFLWLEGKKLRGGYLLVRVSKKQRWLMIKLPDAYVLKGRKPAGWNTSIKSGKTLQQIMDAKKK